jgi:uncharacterized protein YuzE
VVVRAVGPGGSLGTGGLVCSGRVLNGKVSGPKNYIHIHESGLDHTLSAHGELHGLSEGVCVDYYVEFMIVSTEIWPASSVLLHRRIDC